jgi:tRNA(fMet)-specific endonuclease VapC
MYLLDSNAWIALFRKKSAKLLAELKRRPAAEIVTCPIVLAELWYGVCRSDPAYRPTNQQLVEDVRAKYLSVPLDDTAAFDSAELRAYLAAKGQPIGPYDLLIAAIARTRGITLVTRNRAEFSRVPGLLIENWEDS